MAQPDTNGSVRFRFSGREFEAPAGMTLAAALWAAGIRTLGKAPNGDGRGAFCMMGTCQQCFVIVRGQRVEACRLVIENGLVSEAAT